MYPDFMQIFDDRWEYNKAGYQLLDDISNKRNGETKSTMKFTLTFKHPDVTDQIDDILDSLEQSGESRDSLDDLRDEMLKTTKKFVEYSEYIDVEFDSSNGTCRVLEI